MPHEPLFAILFCFIVSGLSFRRVYQLSRWKRQEGRVIGPADSSGDSSHVRIQFVDSNAVTHEFTSGLAFGANSKTPSGERIPFRPGQMVTILVNPKDPLRSELYSEMLFTIPFALLFLTLILAYFVFTSN